MLKLKRIVIKIGTSILLDQQRKINAKRVGDLAHQVKKIREKGIKPIIVSSGAIACGMEMLGLKKKPKEIERKQALAAIGQGQLMKMYMEAFARKQMKVGQVLLTHEDIKSKTRCLNLMNTLNTLLRMDIVPVINENDTLSFKEIRFGDNDNLSALIAQICEADLLLLLSDVEGLFDQDPNKNPDARIIRLVEKIDEKIEKTASGTSSEQSTGGMKSKLEAVKKAGSYGIPTMIVKGGTKEIILKALRGDKTGTLFRPERKLARNKWWTAYAFKVKGKIQIDKGAEQAVLANKKSLLPAGVRSVKGDFSRGDCVEVLNTEGRLIAKGLTNYSAADIHKIKGLRSMEIEKKLGHAYAEEVVHRDNMVVLS